VHFLRVAVDLAERFIDLLNGDQGGADLLLGAGQLVPGQLGFVLGAHGKGGNEVGDHREAAAGLTGPTRFNRRVHRQNPGLEGDLVEPFDHPVRALGGGADLVHRGDGKVGGGPAALHAGDGRIRFFHALRGSGGGVGGTGLHLSKGGRGLFQAGGRAFRAAGKVLRRLGDLGRALAQLA
jgi:hypothetical protein